MVRIKNTPTKMQRSVQKAVKAAANVVKEAQKGMHTTKLKVPFKPASKKSIEVLKKGKKGLIKQLKRRWRSGTVAKREIRKLSRTTNLLFPRRPFQRLVREIAQDYRSDMRFKKESILAIQEAAENFVTETLHKADMARKHAKRHTLHKEDVRFSRFMTPESLWVLSDKIWDDDTFTISKEVAGQKKLKQIADASNISSSSKKRKGGTGATAGSSSCEDKKSKITKKGADEDKEGNEQAEPDADAGADEEEEQEGGEEADAEEAEGEEEEASD